MAVLMTFITKRAQLADIELDASLSEVHSASVEVTDHPVESGASISDHARALPEQLTIEGLVTNNPLWGPTQPATEAFQKGRPVRASAPSRSGAIYRKLLALKDAGTAIDVKTGLREYTDMVITSLNVPRDASTGDALRFSITLKQIKTATLQVIQTEDKAMAKKDLGPKQPKTTPASTEGNSLLYNADAPSLFRSGNFFDNLVNR